MSINWRWIGYRVATAIRCRHVWVDGDTAGRKSCEICGVWRWFPTWRRNRGKVDPDPQEGP